LENNDIVTGSIVVAVIAFVVLCVFLIQLLRAAQRSLITAQGAIREVKETVESLQGDVKKLATNVNQVADDLQGKLRSVDPLFDAVEDVGKLLTDVTGTARIATHHLTQSFFKQSASKENNEMKLPNWLHWAAIGTRVIAGARKGWIAQNQANKQHQSEVGNPMNDVSNRNGLSK
jgi:uncharacterized protein YoxC